MNINFVALSGRLTRDAEVYQTKSGGNAIRMGMAVNDRRKNQQTGEWEDIPNFFELVMFDNNNTRKWMIPYLTKGFKVTIAGRLRYDSWTKDGEKHSRTQVVVDNIEATWPRKEGGYQRQAQQYQQHAQQYQQPAQQYQQQSFQQQYEDDDLPF